MEAGADRSAWYFVLLTFAKSLPENVMLTDAPPRQANRAGFLESDRFRNLELPQNWNLTRIANSIGSAMEHGTTAAVRRACADLLGELSELYKVPACDLRVLAARPLRVRESWTSRPRREAQHI